MEDRRTSPGTRGAGGGPDDVRASLPVLPRGHQYVQLDGEVVLVAVQSRMVLDGVSRNMRRAPSPLGAVS
jgi:hypothetical protein